MAVYKYGTEEIMPEGYQPIRDILAGMGYGPDKVGWNPQTKNPIVMGNELDASKLLFGSDQRYYATPDILNPMLASLGLSTQAAAPKTYTSPYATQIDAVTQQILNRQPFQFDPNTDIGFQQASKEIQNKIMLDFAKRNMLYSPATGQAVSQGIANALPAYEQMAYQRYMAEGDQLNNKLNVLMNLDDRSFNLYRDAIDNEYQEWEKNRLERLDQLDAQYRRIDYAFKKLDELEVADNEIASILGIPVGTKSQAAKARAEEMKNRLEIMKVEEEQQIRAEQRALANEKALISYRESIQKQKEQEPLGTPEQLEAYNEFLKIYSGQSSTGKYANDPYAAYQRILGMRGEHVALLGEKLYNKLLSDIAGMMEVQRTYGPVSYGPSNYDSNPVFQEEMSAAVSDPEGWLEIFNQYPQKYYLTFGNEGVQKLVKAANENISKKSTESAKAAYERYYRMIENNPKGFRKLLKDEAERNRIIDEVGIDYYEKLKAKANED